MGRYILWLIKYLKIKYNCLSRSVFSIIFALLKSIKWGLPVNLKINRLYQPE